MLGADRFGLDEVFIPSTNCSSFIVDRHFTDPGERRRSPRAVSEHARQNWIETGKDYEARSGPSWNSVFRLQESRLCGQMMSDKKALEGQRINFGPMDITCTTCYQTFAYDGS